MDAVRCLCPHDSQGTRCGRNRQCAIHGVTGTDPLIPYALSPWDRELLKSFRIETVDPADLADVREADEQRFNPPRIQP